MLSRRAPTGRRRGGRGGVADKFPNGVRGPRRFVADLSRVGVADDRGGVDAVDQARAQSGRACQRERRPPAINRGVTNPMNGGLVTTSRPISSA